ncbi:uncharacterized protein LOC141559126 isoform X2 [Sminthopsis crassicaudata]|uniref:uncharacterized protein LOC141559126 isoform X2 n=1 Tax=Sminthopsis crassicaudata TaxID=9301 RepID=UPI003D692EF3
MWIWDSYQAHLAVHPKPMATLEGAAGAPRCPPPPAAPCHSPSQWGPPSRPAFREQADDRSVPSQEGRSELMITQKADHKILQIHLSCEKREQRLGLSHRGQTAAQGSVSSGGALTWISSRRSSCSLGPHSLLQSPGSSGQRPRPGRRHQGSEARRVLFRRRHKAFPRPWVQEKAGLGGGGDGPVTGKPGRDESRRFMWDSLSLSGWRCKNGGQQRGGTSRNLRGFRDCRRGSQAWC